VIEKALRLGLCYTAAGSTAIEMASKLPLSLLISKPVTGHRFSSGSPQLIEIEERVVPVLRGALLNLGKLHVKTSIG